MFLHAARKSFAGLFNSPGVMAVADWLKFASAVYAVRSLLLALRCLVNSVLPIVSIVVPFWGYLVKALVYTWLNQKRELQWRL